MKPSITVLFELYFDGPQLPLNSKLDHPAKVSYDGIVAVSKICSPDHPVQNDRESRFFVLDIPTQETVLCELIYYCKLGGHTYKLHWFAGRLISS